jgi:hypothetical protein
MEFHATARIEMSALAIQRFIDVGKLAELCASIEKVLSQQGERGEIYCVWGEFRVHRELIRQGVRFTLPGCPNALQWTITAAPDEPGCVRVHATIDRLQHDPKFAGSLQQFVDNWKDGLESGRASGREGIPRPAGDCMPSYS